MGWPPATMRADWPTAPCFTYAAGDEEVRARWLEWLRSYAARVEQEVLRELPDPERGPEPSWRR